MFPTVLTTNYLFLSSLQPQYSHTSESILWHYCMLLIHYLCDDNIINRKLLYIKIANSQIKSICTEGCRGHGDRVVTLSPYTSEIGVRFPA